MSPEEFLESKNINRNFSVRCNQWAKQTMVVDLLKEFCQINNKEEKKRPNTAMSLKDMEWNSRIWHLEKELQKLKKLP